MPEAALDPCETCPACLQVKAGTHPDLLQVARPDEKHDLPIKVIRDLCLDLGLKPMRGARRSSGPGSVGCEPGVSGATPVPAGLVSLAISAAMNCRMPGPLTQAYTPGSCGWAHFAPKLTTPSRSHRRALSSTISGPPLSPWQESTLPLR